MTWFARTLTRRQAAARHRRELAHLASLPEYLLRDMGLTLDGAAALAHHFSGGKGE